MPLNVWQSELRCMLVMLRLPMLVMWPCLQVIHRIQLEQLKQLTARSITTRSLTHQALGPLQDYCMCRDVCLPSDLRCASLMCFLDWLTWLWLSVCLSVLSGGSLHALSNTIAKHAKQVLAIHNQGLQQQACQYAIDQCHNLRHQACQARSSGCAVSLLLLTASWCVVCCRHAPCRGCGCWSWQQEGPGRAAGQSGGRCPWRGLGAEVCVPCGEPLGFSVLLLGQCPPGSLRTDCTANDATCLRQCQFPEGLLLLLVGCTAAACAVS